MAKPIIYFVAGGTGGHVFPALCVASAFRQSAFDVRIVVDQRARRYIQDQPHRVVCAAGIVGKRTAGKLAALVQLGSGYIQALIWLVRERPALVVGFGGYAALPMLLAAQHLGIKTVVHEQNALMGRVNHLLARRATRVMLSFENTQNLPPAVSSIITGNPAGGKEVEPQDTAFLSLLRDDNDADNRRDKLLLVLGGSLGARLFDDLIPQALAALPKMLRHRLVVLQQTAAENAQNLRQCYAQMGIAADCRPFFQAAVGLMPRVDLMICRAGGGTCAEARENQLPSIMIPLPTAADDHQWYNAQALANSGGAMVLRQDTLDAAALAQHLRKLLWDEPQSLNQMRQSLAEMPKLEPLASITHSLAMLVPSDEIALDN